MEHRFHVGMLTLGVVGLALAVLPEPANARPVLKTLYEFLGDADGATPRALRLDPNCNPAPGTDCILFGTTDIGGVGHGTIYKLTPKRRPPWPQTVLYTFQGGRTDGDAAVGDLLIDPNDGTMYGATAWGGDNDPGPPAAGTVFQLTAGGHEQLLRSFDSHPFGVIFDADGQTLIGTTQIGGSGGSSSGSGEGTLYRLTRSNAPPWPQSILYNFCSVPACADGQRPTAPPTLHPNGTIYGTTQLGGTGFKGTVYSFDGRRQKVLHSFSGDADGGSPSVALVVGKDDSLFGMTSHGGDSTNCSGGCGVVFELAPPHFRYRVIHTFHGVVGGVNYRGAGPANGSQLAVGTDGVLYGTTPRGGLDNGLGGNGVVFSLTPDPSRPGRWIPRVLHQFAADGSEGSAPSAVIVDSAHNDTLYGTTLQSRFGGTVWKLTH